MQKVILIMSVITQQISCNMTSNPLRRCRSGRDYMVRLGKICNILIRHGICFLSFQWFVEFRIIIGHWTFSTPGIPQVMFHLNFTCMVDSFIILTGASNVHWVLSPLNIFAIMQDCVDFSWLVGGWRCWIR